MLGRPLPCSANLLLCRPSAIMGFLGRSKSSAALSASYGAPQSPACAMPVPRLAPLEHPHASLSRGARPVWDVLDNAEPFECPSSSFSRPRSRRDARSDLAEDLARASLHSASSDGLSRGSGGRLSISTAATSVSARSRSGSVASLGGVSTSSGWSSSTRSIRSCPAVDDEDGLRSPSSPSVSTMRRDSVPTRTRALSDAAARPPTRRSSDRPTTPPVPPLPSSSQSVRRPSTRELEAAVAFDGLSAPERPADVFQRWQPVTVAFDAKPRSRRTGDAAPAPLTETKLRRAIIVEQIVRVLCCLGRC